MSKQEQKKAIGEAFAMAFDPVAFTEELEETTGFLEGLRDEFEDWENVEFNFDTVDYSEAEDGVVVVSGRANEHVDADYSQGYTVSVRFSYRVEVEVG